jgi:type I restriction enzyme S subunit
LFVRTVKDDLAAFAPATAQKNINLDTLRALHVPWAPLDEQLEVVNRVEKMFARIERRLCARCSSSTVSTKLRSIRPSAVS